MRAYVIIIIVIIDIVYTRASTAVHAVAAIKSLKLLTNTVRSHDMARYVNCEPAVIARMFSLVADLVWMLQLLKVAKIGP